MKQLMQQDPSPFPTSQNGIENDAALAQKRCRMNGRATPALAKQFSLPGHKAGKGSDLNLSAEERTGAAYFLKNSGFSILTLIFFCRSSNHVLNFSCFSCWKIASRTSAYGCAFADVRFRI